MTSPEDYGAGAWFFIHSAAGNAVEAHKRTAFARWMKLMPDMFPCDLCGGHLRDAMRQYPIDNYLESAERLLLWTYLMHDSANGHANADHPTRPRKSSPPWEEVKAQFLSVPSPPSTPPPQPRAPVRQQQRYHPAFENLKAHFIPRRRQ